MDSSIPVILGSALLWVFLALGELSRPVARLLCAAGLHRWRMAANTARHRSCICCRREEKALARHPRPWEWG